MTFRPVALEVLSAAGVQSGKIRPRLQSTATAGHQQPHYFDQSERISVSRLHCPQSRCPSRKLRYSRNLCSDRFHSEQSVQEVSCEFRGTECELAEKEAFICSSITQSSVRSGNAFVQIGC